MTSSPSLTTAPSLFLGRAGLGGRFAARPQGALGTGGTINWGIFKRHFWGELLRHPQIVIQLLHQLAFRPDAVEHLKQQRAQQLFRWNRGTAFARVELRQATVQLPSTSRTSSRIFLSGWFVGTRASGAIYENSPL